MGAFLVSLTVLVPFLQAPGPLPSAGAELLLDPGQGQTLGPECGLGDGGVAAAAPREAAMRCEPGAGTSPGGVAIACRREGVRLLFAGGRELLFAPDGFLHLRSGEVAGQFGGGVELCL